MDFLVPDLTWVSSFFGSVFFRNLQTYMGVFDMAFVSSVFPQLPADCKKWGLL